MKGVKYFRLPARKKTCYIHSKSGALANQSRRNLIHLETVMQQIKRYRAVILTVIVSLCLTAYMYLNPPLASTPLLPLGLYGDLDWYVSRFALSAAFFGLIPFAAALLLGYGPADLGIVYHRKMFRWKAYWIMLPLFVLIIAASSFNDSMRQFYPFSKTMIEISIEVSPLFMLIHSLAYLLFYYLPWELLFRGLMILPLVAHLEHRDLGNNRVNAGARNRGLTRVPLIQTRNEESIVNSWKNPALLGIASLQTVPTLLIHFAHPATESLGTIVFGILSAVIVLRTRSIIPVLLLHAAAGIVLDLSLFVQSSLGVF